MTTEKKVIGGITLLTIAILVGGVFFLSASSNSSTSSNSNNNSATSVPESEIISRNGIHWHPKLSIYINGEKKVLDDNIGIGTVHQPIHTHTEDFKNGVVHMEMKGLVTKDDLKLSNFFQIWGKPFNPTQIFDKKNNPEGKISMKVNGIDNTNFGNYRMLDKDNILIRYE